MEALTNLGLGLSVALTYQNIIYCFIGVFIGTLVGVLPGIGPLAALSMLLPVSFAIGDPSGAIILLAGIFYGTQYGGSTTSILLKLPGEVSSVVTTIDGYGMTQRGRGGAALAIAAISSFIAGTIAVLIMLLVSGPLSTLAYTFGPVEYSVMMFASLLLSVVLIQGGFLKGIGMVCIGILLGLIGVDINTGIVRFSFDTLSLSDGISFGLIAMGLIGLAEILWNLLHTKEIKTEPLKLKTLYPNKEEIKESYSAALRGTVIGSILGILPGGGIIISSFASYVVEKKLSKNPNFGSGAPAGVAGPEAANNAASQTGFMPLLTLGIPTTPVMAIMLSALLFHGIYPGPQTITQTPDLFWGLIVSMWVGNLFLLILNLPLIGIWVKLLQTPRKILYPIIYIFCILGAYYISNSWFHVLLLIPLTIIGYIFKQLGCEPAPLALGFIIGPMFEEYLRRSLTISQGNWNIFLESPISLTILVIIILTLFFKLTWPFFFKKEVQQ